MPLKATLTTDWSTTPLRFRVRVFAEIEALLNVALVIECRSDPAMRVEIESLLRQQEGASKFIEEPALHLVAESLTGRGDLSSGQVISHYEIVSLIGSGGMGEVYLAHDRQLDRKVALKLVRRTLASDDMLRHFKREEHLLASLNHPDIAQLHGSGVTAEGVPFLVMEYVEGQRLDDYCNELKLGTEERLQLFRKVCSAVTYAHQRLVIHRDLKPANIRVSVEGEPKLLDFGIAKLIDTEEGHSSGMTQTLQGVMTPEYAGPEQIRGESITTASDVYSFGVVLYELLTGQRLYRLTSRRPEELSRAIAEQTPARPSAVVAAAPSPPEVPATPSSPLGGQLRRGRRIHFRRRGRRRYDLRGDLDNIVLMAMRKEPERRYNSVGQFSADIGRHLEGRPVIARKDTIGYRASKFITRNKVGVSAAALILLAILLVLVVSLSQAKSAQRQRDVAEREKSKTEQINTFLQDVLGAAAPEIKGVDVKVVDGQDLTPTVGRTPRTENRRWRSKGLIAEASETVPGRPNSKSCHRSG